MRLRIIVFLVTISAFFASCEQGGNKFAITGEIANMPEQTVYLHELGIDKITVIDSAQTDKSGGFKLKGTAPEPGLYRISFSASNTKNIILSIDKGDIKITGEWNAVEQSKIAGSESSESLSKFFFVFRDHIQDFNTMGMVLDTFKARGNDSMVAIVLNDIKEMNFKLTHFIEDYADSTSSLPNAIFAVQLLNPQSETAYFKQFVSGMNKRFPDAKMAKDFTAKMNNIQHTLNAPAASNGLPEIGTAAPEISLQAPDGKVISLTSLKGKYVLVDFWASWCGPCRKENPNVVTAFNKFKDKNFTILGVSLDEDKEKWQEAIQKDGLAWLHVSDLKGWQSVAARTYSIQSIPANFLIDPQGVIIASDLRGEDLAARLAEVLK